MDKISWYFAGPIASGIFLTDNFSSFGSGHANSGSTFRSRFLLLSRNPCLLLVHLRTFRSKKATWNRVWTPLGIHWIGVTV